ncbi:MAG: amylo-alpha-1,6-glucosidase, partial [bacterium]
SLIAAWQLLDWNPGICKATLSILSQFQGEVFHDEREEEPGKILHETDLEKNWHAKGYFPFPYYGSVDSTPLFLIVFSLYFKKTKDRNFLESHWENILKALNWLEDCGDRDKDYFLEYQRKNPNGLLHQGWKDSFDDCLKIKTPVAIVEAQGYQYLALTEISELATMRKDFDLAKRLKARSEKLREEFNKKFWMPRVRYFALALDGHKKQRKAITSNPGHLLFTGILEKDKSKAVINRLFEPDLWTSYGIRTHSTKEPDFREKQFHLGVVWPHDNWIIAQGFKKFGFEEEYRKIKKALFLAHKEIGFLPEYYGVKDNKIIKIPQANYPQAWATCALFNFLGLSF